MKRQTKKLTHAALLRQKAEELLKLRSVARPCIDGDKACLASIDAQPCVSKAEIDLLKLVHELEVHQIELELQNEELIIAKDKAELAEEKYTELYDFAPSGYITLSKEGKISQLNFAAARMLGKERFHLVTANFTLFVSAETRHVFNAFFQRVFTRKTKQTCELVIAIEGNLPIYVSINGVVSQNNESCFLTLTDITETKKASIELFEAKEHAEESETRFRNYIQSSPTAVFLVDKQGKYTFVNHSACKLLGYSKEELLQLSVFDMVTPDVDEKNISFSELKRTGEIRNVEKTLYRKDGQGIDVILDAKILSENEYIGFVKDITERKLAETEIKIARKKAEESETKFRALSENSPAIIYRILLNPTFKFDYVSPAVTKISGYTPDDHYADPDLGFKLIHPDDRIILEKTKHKTQGEPIILRWIAKDGKTIWTEQRNVLIFDPSGNPFAIEGIATDITLQKEAEEDLRKSEEQLKAIFENSLNPIMIADDAGNYIKVNQAAAAMFHYPVERMVQMNVGDIQTTGSPDAAKRYQEYLAKGFEIGEFDFVRPDNSVAIAQYHAVRVRENFNMSILSDITERKLAEEKLKESEAKYRQLYEFNQMPIAIFDVDTLNFLSVNNAWVDKYGYTKEELLSMTILEIRPESEWEKVRQSVRQMCGVLENVGEYLHKKKNGEIIKVEIIRYDLVFEGKNAKLVFANDITDRKLAETALAQSRSELKAIYELSPVMMCLVNDNRQVIFANQAFTKLTGTDEERLKGGHACGVFGCINALDDSKGCGFGTNCQNCNLRLAMDDTLKNGTVHTNVEYHTTLLQNGETREVVLLGSTALIDSYDQRKLLLCLTDITDRKLAEEALRNSETNYRRLFETLSEGVALNEIVYNDQGEMVDYRILEVNPAFYITARYDGPVIGRLATDLYQMPAEFITAFWREHKERHTVQFTEMISPVNGRYVLVATSPFLNDRFVTSFFDINERKQAEQELIKAKEKAEESEEKYRLLFENANEAIYIVQNEKLVFTNPACELITGISKENLIGYSISDFVDENDRDNLLKHHFKLINGITQNHNSVFTLINQKGEKRHVSINSVLINWNGLPATLNFGTDITERKEAEEELIKAKERTEESEQRLFTYINSIPDIICYKDEEGKWLLANNADLELFRLQGVDYFGKTDYELSAYTDEIYKNAFISCMETDEIAWKHKLVSTGIEIIPTANGGKRVYEVIKVPVFHANGERKGLAVIGRDISMLYETQDNLIIAKDKAQESDRLKSAFLANMSHEIRTPMNGILGFADLLKDPELTGEQQQQYIKIIEKSGTRMLNIINDIVDISKIEAGLMKLHLTESNINEQIEYVYTFFKPEVEAKGISFSFKNALPAQAATIKTDREKVFAILTNLVKNAIKYTRKGAIEFGYILHGNEQGLSEQSTGAVMEFFVKDTGIGIPNERQAAIFERFVQADIEDRDARQGAGLGLAITKSYVEMLGGKIWVASQVEEGSVFYFTLPYKTGLGGKTVVEQSTCADKSDDGKKLKILIADDDEVSEKLIAININKLGREIIRARTGTEAVITCSQNTDIDLILMDIQMPEMSGYEATRKIREFNKDVIIIAQTAYGLTGDREKAIAAGCNDYLSKPINKEELRALIMKYFGT